MTQVFTLHTPKWGRQIEEPCEKCGNDIEHDAVLVTQFMDRGNIIICQDCWNEYAEEKDLPKF